MANIYPSFDPKKAQCTNPPSPSVQEQANIVDPDIATLSQAS